MAGVLYIDTSFTKITVKPVHPTFGAEIQVPDWNNLDDDAVREISNACNKVKLIVPWTLLSFALFIFLFLFFFVPC